MQLASAGHDVYEAANGTEGLAAAARVRPEIILLTSDDRDSMAIRSRSDCELRTAVRGGLRCDARRSKRLTEKSVAARLTASLAVPQH